MSFRRRGNSFCHKEEKPVTKVSTIEDLRKERSELHPKYQPESSSTREDGDGEDATAIASISDCTVHFVNDQVCVLAK